MTAMRTKRGAYASMSGTASTQASTAINAIKDYILQAHLQPGDPLPTESQLCTDLGMSRSSVREAVRTLVALDIVEVRATLDESLAEQVIRVWKGRRDRAIDAVVEEMERLAAAGETFTDQDHRFHSMLLDALPNHLFGHLTDAFWAVHTLTVPLLDAPRPEDI